MDTGLFTMYFLFFSWAEQFSHTRGGAMSLGVSGSVQMCDPNPQLPLAPLINERSEICQNRLLC